MSTIFLRDRIVINEQFKNQISPLLGQHSVTIIAREIVHEPGYKLSFTGINLTFIASLYNGNGGAIIVDGVSGAAGATGNTGGKGTAVNGGGTPGGPGGAGGAGQPGTAGASVRLFCEHLTNVRLQANGGAGGAGGNGGAGGHGGDGRFVPRPIDPIEIDGTDGGPGGAGGNGGAGGSGGRASVVFVAADSVPVVQANAGAGGAGGHGGKGGVKGKVGDAVNGANGSNGRAAASGANGQTQVSPVSVQAYWQQVLAELGNDAPRWADYRLEAGEYYYRAYNPAAGGPRADYLKTAMGEFEAVLVMDPANEKARRLQSQVLANLNILGLPKDLDVTPDFPTYENAFLQWGSVIGGVYFQGINTLVTNVTLSTAADQLNREIENIQHSLDALGLDTDAAHVGQEAAGKEADQADARVREIQQQIQAAIDEMNQHSFNLLGLVTTVGEVAIAVVGVVGAAFTGGASLVALAPALATLAADTYAALPSIADNLLQPSKMELDKVKKDYAAAKQDFDKVVAAEKAVISLISTIQKLEAGTTPDNSKYVNLVKQGVEAAHIQLLTRLHKQQADLTAQAAGSRLAAAQQGLTTAQAQLADLQANRNVLKAAALNLIKTARLNLDVLLTDLFKAERSVEIYCLLDQSNRIFFDTGFVHPDIEHDFLEGFDPRGTGLIQALGNSWSQLLTPGSLRINYEAYFAQADQALNILPLAFSDADVLERFRQTQSLSFSVDLSALPANISEAKVQAVNVSLLGAAAPAGITSCTVTHAGLYWLKKRDGSTVSLQLHPHSAIVVSPNTALQTGGVQLTPGNPITTPQSLSFWGRGIAGSWSIAIESDPENPNAVDLASLSQIQVWIVYQGFLG